MNNSNSTIFDDTFRTMLSKMPELIIPMINEVFDTSYPPDIPITRYQDEFYDRHKKMIADSHLRIAHIHYHAECQSTGVSFYHSGADAVVQSLYVQSGKPGAAGGFYECIFRDLVGCFHPAHCRLW